MVCHGALYAIGGANDESTLSTIERINIEDLVSSSVASHRDNQQWKTLDCRLSCDRKGCAAVVVHDRFIIVAGGVGEDDDFLSSIETIDTCSKSQCFVISGPHMNVARSAFGMAVIGSTIYAVGGRRQYEPAPVVGSVVLDEDEWDWLDDYEPYVSSVEYLDVDDWLKEGPPSATSVSTSTMSWQIHKALSLRTPRCDHGMVRVGSCLVVVGGHKIGDSCHSVEALDTQRNVVWELPEIQGAVGGVYNVVAISSGIILINGWYSTHQDSGERLSLVDMNSMCFAQLMALGKASMLTRGGAGFNGRTQQFEKLQNENRELTLEVASLNDEKHKLEQELERAHAHNRELDARLEEAWTSSRLLNLLLGEERGDHESL